nr:NADH-quinone oxidoreductase subunit C [Oceanospirillaceae bacterium]
MTRPLTQSKACPMGDADLVCLLQQQFPHPLIEQNTVDGIPTVWVDASHVGALLRYCKHELQPSYAMLYDITAIDERVRSYREGQPASDFTLVYQLLSLTGNAFVRIKVALMD